MAKPLYRIELAESEKKSVKHFWFRIVHRNGNIIATSETYTTKASRTRIARRLSKETGIEIIK
jgi:uncharacterized protein YegP (UPF0339 family)